jgi:hypothetical protein
MRTFNFTFGPTDKTPTHECKDMDGDWENMEDSHRMTVRLKTLEVENLVEDFGWLILWLL